MNLQVLVHSDTKTSHHCRLSTPTVYGQQRFRGHKQHKFFHISSNLKRIFLILPLMAWSINPNVPVNNKDNTLAQSANRPSSEK